MVSVPIICALRRRAVNVIFPRIKCCPQLVTLSLRLARAKLLLDALRRSGTALFLWTQFVPNPLSFVCFRKDQLLRTRNVTMLETCVFFGRIVASCRVKRSLFSIKSGPTRRFGRVFAQAKSGPRAAPSGLPLRSNRDRRDAPGVRLLRPNRGLVPRQADFLFGQIVTDATLQACVYSGQIGASCRVKRTSSSVTTMSSYCYI
jgi:hypothetical protein